MISINRTARWHATILFLITVLFVALAPNSQADVSQSVVSAKIEQNKLLITYHIPPDKHQTIMEEYPFMTVEVDPVPGVEFRETVYPDGKRDMDGNIEYHGTVVLKKQFVVKGAVPDSIRITAGYQFCTEEGTCLPPESETIQIPFVLEMTDSRGAPPAENQASAFSFGSLLLNLLFAFLGGLILNVMPCVLPVLSIKILNMVNSAHNNRQEILKGSLAYTAGVLISFLIMGSAVAGLKIAGQSVGWGFQFQNVGFNIFLLTIIWVFGLSLFDVFIIQLPGVQTAAKASGKQGHLGSLLTGVFAVLLATPCTAPMLGAALGWTFAQPPAMILLSFLVIGLGLASPFIVIGFFPVFSKYMPKPGAWMNTFKEVMAFLLMSTVVYLLRVVYFLVDGKVIQVVWFLLIVAFAAWIIGKYTGPSRSKPTKLIAILVALAISVFAGFHFLKFEEMEKPSANGSSNAIMRPDPHHPDWMVFQPELLEQFRSENLPVFIDFAAEWCLTCKANESTVLFTKDIKQAFEEKHVQKLRGDYTRKNPLIHEWLGKFNRAGVPLYVFYLPGEDPIVLPEVITKDMIYSQLEKNPD